MYPISKLLELNLPATAIRILFWVLALSGALQAPPLEAQSKTVPANLETVHGSVQTWPGGPREEAEVPVFRVPADFPTVTAAAVTLDDDELVLGVVVAGEAKAYPIRHLSRHEVVGDRIGGVAVAATWCPLSASGVVFARQVDDRALTFDFVRGLIHDNLLISDRETRSIWSQLAGKATSGPLRDRALEVLPSLQTTWAFWKQRHPNTVVLGPADGGAGAAFHYAESSKLQMPPPRGDAHDIASVGLGLHIWGQPAFFPLRELAKAPDPFLIGSGSTAIHVRHSQQGLTAWAEDAAGTLLPSVLVYERSWKAFHPQSRIFEAALACETRP